MFIRITRLLLIIIISMFLGMCIVWLVMYIAEDKHSLIMLKIAIFGSLILIAAILILQLWENRKRKKEQEKIIKQQKAEQFNNDTV
ncbi:MAG: hypothetical protein LBP63_10940 [Prevotellaceae bacterium]|nr:hypothetical protein [Prevotellaceae bacterium]